MGKQARLSLNDAVNTESNLSSQVFENIAQAIGVKTSDYELKYQLIDTALLKRRNNIAHGHGNHLDIGADEYRNLADEVIELIRSFKTDIENSAAQKSYMRNAEQ